MPRRAGTIQILLVGFLLAAPTWAAQREKPTGPVPVALVIERAQQAGPAYPRQPATIEVRVRNVGQSECGVCQVRVIGGGLVASRPLPPVGPGQTVKITVGDMVFPRAGKVVLSVIVMGPPERVDFGGRKPGATLELTVLEGPPTRRGAQR